MNWVTRAPATWSCSARCLKLRVGCRRPASTPRCAAWSRTQNGLRSTNAPWRAAGNYSGSLSRRCDMKADGDPNLIVYFGGQYMPLREARVGILTHALHYGTGVFEGIRAHWDDLTQELFILRPQEHYERWKLNCGILRIDVPMSPEQLSAITVELMRRKAFKTNI